MKDKNPAWAVWKNCLEEACARNNICLEICSNSHAKLVVSFGLKVVAECCTIKHFHSILKLGLGLELAVLPDHH